MSKQFQSAYDPFVSSKSKNNQDDLNDLFGGNPSNNNFDFFSDNNKKDDSQIDFNQNFLNQANISDSFFNEDDILIELSGQGKNSNNQKLQNQTNEYDKIFGAIGNKQNESQKHLKSSQNQIKNTVPKYGQYNSQMTQDQVEKALKGRNLASEAISSEKKKTFFQYYVFDSQKYQFYFNASTKDILENIYNALWPFGIKNQPDGLVIDYNNFCKIMLPSFTYTKFEQMDSSNSQETAFYEGQAINNPFQKQGDTLSFLGRDPQSLNDDNQIIRENQYKHELVELYGPLWIFVTLVIEFIILGHLTNTLQTQNNQQSNEFLQMLMQKNTTATLKRIMKLTFFLACFYLGMPFVSYLIFKGKMAMEVSFVSQLIIFSYSFLPYVPGSFLIFFLQKFWRAKYLSLLILFILQGFYIYKQLYELRNKYFDFKTNKQMAWTLITFFFIYIWVYKSYFLQV